MEMEVIWKTLETNTSPILTYSGEVWKAKKKENAIHRNRPHGPNYNCKKKQAQYA